MGTHVSILILTALAGALCAACGVRRCMIVERPPSEQSNDFHVGNKAPLLPSRFINLPIGAVKPKGWVRKQLELQADGFIGRLPEISRFLVKEDNSWLDPEGKGHAGWEEVPYWLKGYGDTGYLLGDERIIGETRQWIEAVFLTQREDGYFGPRSNLTSIDGKPDFWANMIMLFVLQSYYEYSGDPRVLDLMTKYFHWQMTVPDEDFLLPYWQHQRGGDNLYSVYWLYNRTGDRFLLDLADKIHRRTNNWTDGIPDWHNVNISQGFGEPTTYYMQSKDTKHLEASERNYRTVRDMYGQVPGGMFGADENCRPGRTDPRQAVETCGMVEMMLSTERLAFITGDPKWVDRCEDVAFNSLPAALTADHKALRYLTAPNMVLSDKENKSPGIQNRGPMFLMNPHLHRCCQHNMGHGWPYYAERLWSATPGNGLAAMFYAESEVTAKVGNGETVTISEKTNYPFDENVEFVVAASKPVAFPLYLRIPGWCNDPEISVNGKRLDFEKRPESFVVLDRKWKDGDKVLLTLPMKITVTKWEKNKNSVSVNRGPLTFSLKIGENYVREGGTDEWPAWEIYPTTPWNYGLIIDEKNPEASFEVVRKEWPASSQPFTLDDAPIEIRAKAKRIPNRQLDDFGLAAVLEQGPVKSNEPIETVTLVPMGCARLRISSFPLIGEGPDAKEWPAPPPPPPHRASGIHSPGVLRSISDGRNIESSNDKRADFLHWWPNKATREWVEYDLKPGTTVSAVDAYWLDDGPDGGCRAPKSWALLYKDGDNWKPVSNPSEYGVEKDKHNRVTFDPVTTNSLRLEIQLTEDFSSGLLQWRVETSDTK